MEQNFNSYGATFFMPKDKFKHASIVENNTYLIQFFALWFGSGVGVGLGSWGSV